jgi:molecular chaperone DnaK (HSP70)
VKPAYGLTDEQVESMILESFDHAEEDIHLRQLVEARNEAENILSKVEKAPDQPAWQLLEPEEAAEIRSLTAELAVLKQGDDLQALRAGFEALDKATHRLAELMMDDAVTSAIKGRTMQSADDKLGQGPTAPHPIAQAEFMERK